MVAKKVNKPTENDDPEFKSTEEFESLSTADKEKVWNYYNREIPESEMRPLTKAERARFAKMQRRSVGRPQKSTK